MMVPFLIRSGTLYLMWSVSGSAPFIELARAPSLSEWDFGWWRIHVKVDWRPKGWNEAEHHARLSNWWD